MITAPAAFTAALNQNSRHFDAKIIHSGAEVDCDIQSIGSKKGAQDGQTFSLGSVFSSSAEITCSGLTDNLLNEDIEIQIGILLSDGTYSYITYGQFTVISAPKTAYQTILSCVGFISSKFNLMLPSVGDSPTISTIAQAIQTATGISVTFPGISSVLGNTLAQTLSGVTCRTALAIIAFLVGGYATENASGGVEIHQYTLPQARQPVLAENCLSAPIVSEERFEMTGIKVIVNSEAYVLTADTTVNASKTYYERTGTGASDDPYIYTPVESPAGNPASQGWYEVTEIAYSSGSPIRQTYSSPYMTQAIFNNFASAVVGLAFDPAEIDDSLGNPLFEPWDCLTVTDVDGSTQYTVPCHLIESNFDGGFFSEIWSIGESLSDLPVEGSLTQKVDETVQQLAMTQAAAEQAKAAATSARTYAEEAKQTTDIIKDYAEEAGETVEEILDDALSAGQSAQEAKESAGAAYNSASLAINQLGVVEDIVGVLDLVRKNGTYERTTDPEPIPSKWYFVRTGSGTSADPYVYAVQTNVVFEYVLTTDTDIVQGKPYYTRSGAGTEADPYVYAEVENPVVADIGTYYEYTNWNYFQLTGVDSTIQNYVSDHIVYAGGVLSLQNGATRVQLSTNASDGLIFFNNGQQVAQYGTDAVIGDPNGVHIVLTADYNGTGKPRLSFYMGSRSDTEVAYISDNMLYITQTVVLQEMKVGDSTYGQWSWKVHTTTINGNTKNNLYLKWLG